MWFGCHFLWLVVLCSALSFLWFFLAAYCFWWLIRMLTQVTEERIRGNMEKEKNEKQNR